MTIITLPSTGQPPVSSPSNHTPTIRAVDLDAAICPQTDPDAFHSMHNITDEKMLSLLRACSVCTISDQCLDIALEQLVEEDWGVWGGTTRAERKDIRSNPELREFYTQRLIDIRSNRVSSNPRRADLQAAS